MHVSYHVGLFGSYRVNSGYNIFITRVMEVVKFIMMMMIRMIRMLRKT